jgi:hypothetical protein
MELYGKGTEVWEIDEGLRKTAQEIMAKFPDELGHIDLDKIVFVRVSGVKLKKDRNWYGKCWRIPAPVRILPRFVFQRLGNAGVLDLTNLGKLEDILDICYIIGISTDAIEMVGGDLGKLEEVTLHHELLHVAPDMESLVPHEIQDFGNILQRYGIYWTQGVIEESAPGPKAPTFLQSFARELSRKGSSIQDVCEESD